MMKFLRKLFGDRPKRGDTRVTYWLSPAVGWNWHCQDGNNKTVCQSNQGYGSEPECLEGIENARDALNSAVIVKREMA